MTDPSDAVLAQRLHEAVADCLRAVSALSDDELREPSGLPDWSRAHLLAHLWGIAEAMTRQIEYARRDRTIELYDGGYEGRTARIEEGASASAGELRERLSNALTAADDAVSDLRPDDWNQAVSYRSGVVRDGVFALWREFVIHTSDLQAGRTPADWTAAFCEHLLDFLVPRVPDGLTLELHVAGRPVHRMGSGARTIVIEGSLTDVAAWLAGRRPAAELTARSEQGAVPIPDLEPWPSGVPVPGR